MKLRIVAELKGRAHSDPWYESRYGNRRGRTVLVETAPMVVSTHFGVFNTKKYFEPVDIPLPYVYYEFSGTVAFPARVGASHQPITSLQDRFAMLPFPNFSHDGHSCVGMGAYGRGSVGSEDRFEEQLAESIAAFWATMHTFYAGGPMIEYSCSAHEQLFEWAKEGLWKTVHAPRKHAVSDDDDEDDDEYDAYERYGAGCTQAFFKKLVLPYQRWGELSFDELADKSWLNHTFMMPRSMGWEML